VVRISLRILISHFCYVLLVSKGILRFHAKKSVDLAMKRFRTEEIVVQDVAVQVKVLRPGSKNISVDEDEGLLVSGGSDNLS
jgi:hypothetical protein